MRVDAEDAGEGVREDTSWGANAGSKALEAWTRVIGREIDKVKGRGVAMNASVKAGARGIMCGYGKGGEGSPG